MQYYMHNLKEINIMDTKSYINATFLYKFTVYLTSGWSERLGIELSKQQLWPETLC